MNDQLITTKMSSNKLKTKPVNVCIALRNRACGLFGSNFERDMLHIYGENCAAKQCTDNQKAKLPPRTRTTFMTAFSPNHEIIASCHGDHMIHVTNLRTKKLINSLSGHERSPWCVCFHPSSNDILATGCLNGEVRVWDLRSGGSEAWVCNTTELVVITSLSFHPTDHVLLIAAGNEIYFWDWKVSKPFASVKTALATERVQLVRFDSFGSHILTAVVNAEEERHGGDEDDLERDPLSMPVDLGALNAGLRSQLVRSTQRRSWLRNWLQQVSPVFNETTNRSSTARPATASYNLRGRQNTRTNSIDNITGGLSNDATRVDRVALYRPSLRQRLQDYRSRVSDTQSRPRNYSRDYERVLHASVSVNAEIQHQYSRLQVLRQERRRLEMRVQQLQNHPRSLAATRRQANLTSQSSAEPANTTTNPYNLRSLVGNEQEAFSDFHEITDQLATRVHARLMHELHDPNIEVSVGWGTQSNSSGTEQTRASTFTADVLTQARPVVEFPPVPSPSAEPSVSMPAPLLSTVPFGLIEEPIEEPDAQAFPSYPSSLYVPDSPPLPSRSLRQRPLITIQPSNQPFFPSTRPAFLFATDGGNIPDVEPTPASSRSAHQRLRNRFSRRVRQMNRHSMGHVTASSLPDTFAGFRDKTTYRLQWWDFTKCETPEISSSNTNVVVTQAKIHNDSSVDISKDGLKVATLIWADTPTDITPAQIGVFSLEKKTFGQLIYRKHFGPTVLCLSLSPLGNYLAVGLKYYLSYLNEGVMPNRNVMAKIVKLEGDAPIVHEVTHPVNPDTPQRYVNINTIAWLPGIGEGLVYGTNTGELRICHTSPRTTSLGTKLK